MFHARHLRRISHLEFITFTNEELEALESWGDLPEFICWLKKNNHTAHISINGFVVKSVVLTKGQPLAL